MANDLKYFHPVPRRKPRSSRDRGSWIFLLLASLIFGAIGVSGLWLMRHQIRTAIFPDNHTPLAVTPVAEVSKPLAETPAAIDSTAKSLSAPPSDPLPVSQESNPSVTTVAPPASSTPTNTKEQMDLTLAKINAALKTDPKNIGAYNARGNIYARERLWDQAKSDFKTALQIDPTKSAAKLNLAQIDFVEKNYDQARIDYAGLQNDKDYSDYANFEVFLCDLAGGHEDAAGKELDAFNRVGSNPSYYFGNVAWDLAHQKPDDARGFLQSALQIYAPQKLILYGANLKSLGYLPIPSAAEGQDKDENPHAAVR